MQILTWWRMLKSQGITKVNLSVTNLCNYKCVHCNIWKIYKTNPAMTSKEMPIGDFMKILDNTTTLKWISITGGEPFLKPGIDKFFSTLPEHIQLVSINTNGSFPHIIHKIIEDAVYKFKNKTFYVSISLDGPEHIHDRIRGVKGAFKNAIILFTELKKIAQHNKNLNVNFEYTISPWNLGKFPKLINQLQNMGIKASEGDFVFSLYELAEYYNNLSFASHDYDYRMRVLQEIEEILRMFSYITISPSSLFSSSFLALAPDYYTRKKKHKCMAGERSVWVDPFGNVRMCIYKATVLGNVADYDFDLNKIVNSRLELIRDLRNKCRGCWTPCESYTTWYLDQLY